MKIYSSAAYILPGIEGANYTEHNIIKDVCGYFNVSVEDVKKKTGDKKAKQTLWLLPRQVGMFFIVKNYPDYSLEYIGSLFNRDHATVINALKKVQNFIDTEPRFRIKIEEVHKIITNNKNLFSGIKMDSTEITGIKYIIECLNP
jgi:chromosomal replication initiation ATPase DnaA